MITSSDKEYIETKLIKLGQKKLSGPLNKLAEWIHENYGVRPLNIYYDLIEHNQQPRLQVIFEHYSDSSSFLADNKLFPNSNRQTEVENAFRELIRGDKEYTADNVYILFRSFEPIAKEEANSKITKEKLLELKNTLGLTDLWELNKNFHTCIFFFFTDKQVSENEKNGTKQLLKESYFKLIKECDEFGYINKDSFEIAMDSKENFDKNYQSNWFYYFKDH